MLIKDSLQRFIFDKAPVRGEFIHLQESFQTIVNQHAYPKPIRKLLGEALCVAGLLTAILKFSGRLTVQFQGKGNLKLMLAQCDHQFNLRGLVKWDGDLSYEDLMSSINEGVLVITLDGGAKKNSYQGIVPWRGNSLVESIEGYFRDSEQLATRIWLEVDDVSAGGFLLQIIPDNKNDKSEWERITGLTSGLNQINMLKLDHETLLKMLYPEDDIRLFDEVNVSFGCTCSRKRSGDAIKLLGKEEAEAELKDKQSIVVTCDFCNREYVFDRVDVAQLFEDDTPPPTDIHLH